jgi:hypothetical protein
MRVCSLTVTTLYELDASTSPDLPVFTNRIRLLIDGRAHHCHTNHSYDITVLAMTIYLLLTTVTHDEQAHFWRH